MSYIVYIFIIALIYGLYWLSTSVTRGAIERNQALNKELGQIIEKLEKGIDVAQDEIDNLAAKPHLRELLYFSLGQHQQTDLFPEKYCSNLCQAEGKLAYWLMHPNELGDYPKELKLVQSIKRQINGKTGEFIILRYIARAGHWAEDDGWLLGIVGPFYEDELPYFNSASAFSRFDDKHEETDINELIDWFTTNILAE